MKRILVFFNALLMLVLACIPAPAQQSDFAKKERRIFLWDVTISMVGATQHSENPLGTKRTKPSFDYTNPNVAGVYKYYNKEKDIFDKTRETLIQQIENIKNESTEIIVLPFRNEVVGEFTAQATAEGKAKLRSQIMGWDDLRLGGTYTGSCLKKAIEKATDDRKNQIILLTDGEPSNNEGIILLDVLKSWRGRQEAQNLGRLVYVMLTEEADGDMGQKIKELAEESDGKLLVITPDEDIAESVYIKLGDKTSIHVRDFFDNTVSSNGRGSVYLSYQSEGPEIPGGYTTHVTVEENEFVEIDAQVSPENGSLIIPFRLKKSLEENLASLPHDYNLPLVLTFEDNKNFSNVRITEGFTAGLELVLQAEPRVTISWTLQN